MTMTMSLNFYCPYLPPKKYEGQQKERRKKPTSPKWSLNTEGEK